MYYNHLYNVLVKRILVTATLFGSFFWRHTLSIQKINFPYLNQFQFSLTKFIVNSLTGLESGSCSANQDVLVVPEEISGHEFLCLIELGVDSHRLGGVASRAFKGPNVLRGILKSSCCNRLDSSITSCTLLDQSGPSCKLNILRCCSHHYYRNLYRGGQKRFTEAGIMTASVRSQ